MVTRMGMAGVGEAACWWMGSPLEEACTMEKDMAVVAVDMVKLGNQACSSLCLTKLNSFGILVPFAVCETQCLTQCYALKHHVKNNLMLCCDTYCKTQC